MKRQIPTFAMRTAVPPQLREWGPSQSRDSDA
jgi:hypothetical protein